MLTELLSEEDKNVIEDYINMYSGGSMRAPVEKVLDEWDFQKRDLYKLLGNNLIKEVTIDCAPISTDEYRAAINRVLDKYKPTLRSVLYVKLMNDFDSYVAQNIAYEVLSTAAFMENRCGVHQILTWGENDKYTIRPEAKPTTVLSKICARYGLLGIYENFLKDYSKAATLKGQTSKKIYLSIHPMDFMTASDNDSNWQSCFNWRNPGDYRSATVALMNDPAVVIAYAVDDKPMNDVEWNSKTWREFFVVDKDVICEVKSYPYNNEALSAIILNKLKELAQANWATEYSETDTLVYQDELKKYNFINFECDSDVIYNDFGLMPRNHLGVFGKNLVKGSRRNYGGKLTCMCCGHDIPKSWFNETYDMYHKSPVTCSRCNNEIHTCHHCGSFSSELTWIDDYTQLCPYCLAEDCWFDYYDESYVSYDIENPITVALLDEEGRMIDSVTVTSYSLDNWRRHHKGETIYEAPAGEYYDYYMLESDILDVDTHIFTGRI